ncbi:MAG: lipopolysaccharide biosynthesis protein [Planctomycetia bacterium]
MSRHRTVIASLVCNYAATACQIICGLAVVPMSIRYLGEEGYGTWLGLTALGAIGGLADMGVSGVLVVRLSRALGLERHDDASAELLSGLAVSAASSVIGGMLVLGAVVGAGRLSPGSFAVSTHVGMTAAALAFAAMLSQFSVSLTALPTAQLRPIVTGLVGIATPMAWLFTSWLLVPRLGMAGLAAGFVIRAVVACVPLGLYNAWFLLRPGGGGTTLDLARCRSFVMLGTTGFLVRWVQSVLGTFDVVCVSATQGPAAATSYANTAKPTMMATGLANAFGGALLPPFTRFLAREKGPPAFKLFLNSLRLTTIVAGSLAIAFAGVRRQFLTAWVGEHFILPIPLTLAIALAAVASCTLAFASYMFGSTGRLLRAQVVTAVEGVTRLSLMAGGAAVGGSLGMAACAIPTPFIVTGMLLHEMGRFTNVRIPFEDWLALVVDLVLIAAGLVAVSLLPFVPLGNWQIPLAAAAFGGVALIVLALRSAPLRKLLFETADAVLPSAVRRILPVAMSGVK